MSSFSEYLRCPDDGHLLQLHPGTSVPFASCRHCDGIWITHEAMEKGGKLEVPRTAYRARSKGEPSRRRACPRCSTGLDAEKVDGVPIDVCPRCRGVWLDPGEYPAARTRSLRRRFERDLPGLKRSQSLPARFLNRIVDFIGEHFIEEREELPEFEPRGLIPKAKRRD